MLVGLVFTHSELASAERLQTTCEQETEVGLAKGLKLVTLSINTIGVWT
jgi:hypothetical protein